jgi:hypothetical protein
MGTEASREAHELYMKEIDMSKKPTLVLTYPGKLSTEEIELLKMQWFSNLGNKVIILENGMTLNAIINDDMIATDGY